MRAAFVDVLVEEPSMEAALRLLLPKMLEGVPFEVYPFRCKDDLLAKLPDRLRGYSKWLKETARIVVVVVDRDDDDCVELTKRLEKMAQQAGLTSRTARGQGSYQVVNRLAIEELEAWFFGDWFAVRAAYPRVASTVPAKAKYRDPDAVSGGTWEAFERLLQTAGYFAGGLRKIEAARAVAEHMVPSRNASASFCALRRALQDLAEGSGEGGGSREAPAPIR